MLSLMRRHAKSWFIKLALGAVAVVFVFWGVGSYTASRAARVALVNGQPITVFEFNQTYRNLLDQARQRFGDALNDELIKSLNLRRQAMDRLIGRQLIIQAAENAGVVIGDRTILAAIESDPAFQAQGRFSVKRYQRLLAHLGMEPTAYEAAKREDLAIARMQSRVAMLSLVSEEEARDYFHWLRDEVKISYVAFKPADFESQIQPEDKAVASFFEKNREAYRAPEQVVVEYLTFLPQDFLDQVQIDPQEVKEDYEISQDSFLEPEKVRLRHILFTKPPSGDEKEEAAKRKTAEEVLAKAKSGEDFAALAKKYSQGPAAEQGGEVGWLTRDQLSPELKAAVFSLEPGQVSDLIVSQIGFHILKVEEKKAARVPPFEEVKGKIEEKIRTEAALEKALAAAESAYGLSAGVSEMDQLAAKIGRKALRVGPFSKIHPPQGIPSQPEFLEAAFNEPVGEVGPVIELDSGYCLLLVKEKIPSYLPELKDVSEQVARDFVQEEARRLAREEAEKFLAQAKNKDWLDEVKKAGRSLEAPAAFTRHGQVPDLGFDQALNEAAFRLSARRPWPDQVFEVGDKFVVIHFEDHLPASSGAFETSKKQLMDQLRAERQRQLSTAWLEALRRRAEIEIDKRFL